MTEAKWLERSGIVVGIGTGVAALVISMIGLSQTQATQKHAEEREQAAQANLVVAEIVQIPAGGRALIQNFSGLPIYKVRVSGILTLTNVGTLPPCSQVDITGTVVSDAVRPKDGIPSVGIDFIDASGTRWWRQGSREPQRGRLPDDTVAKIKNRGGNVDPGGEVEHIKVCG